MIPVTRENTGALRLAGRGATVEWAVELRRLGMFGFVEALIFIAILFVGLIYAWERGALDWD